MPNFKKRTIILLSILMLLSGTLFASDASLITVTFSENIDAEFHHYPANGKHAILWIAPDYGFHKAQHEMAHLLSKKGIEIWMFDLTESLFLTRGSQSMKTLTGDYVLEAIKIIFEKTNKKITLVSSFYGAIPVLRGARKWQLIASKTPYLNGAILFSPVLYDSIPSLGKDPTYLPIASATNIPIMIFQGGSTGTRWQLSTLLDKFHANKSQTFFQIMPGIYSVFYNENRSEILNNYFKILPGKINVAVNLLARKTVPASAEKLVSVVPDSPKQGLDIELKDYKGNITPLPILLTSIKNKIYERGSYNGKVTLINFWATWCPPCVKEIPSLNLLSKNINHPDFEILSINYSESPDTIKKFLTRIKVDFPILLDSDGKFSRQWKVIVFPSTYIIDKKGKIKYGVNAAIDWGSKDVKKKILTLLNE